jgi:carbon-monoxide dehydrogenase small subunit
MTVDFILNGEDVSAKVRSGDRLSTLLRESFSLKSVRGDCLEGRCGACLVLLDGRPVPSCSIPAFRVSGREVVTIEGIERTEGFADITGGFERAGASPCPFCRDAKYLAVEALLSETVRPTRERTLECLSTVECGCGEPISFAQGVEYAADLRYRRKYEG